LKSEEPQFIPLPGGYEEKCTQFQKLMILKVLRDEKLIYGIKEFVKKELGHKYIESPPFDLPGAYNDSQNTTPIIFVLSPGADPITYLLGLAKSKGMDQRLKIISLGQGQGRIAEKLIEGGHRNGDWVCLQNCHLSVSWMPELEKIQERQDEATMNPDYRLWLTSMPDRNFPVPVL
jgi:dynein heavy chain